MCVCLWNCCLHCFKAILMNTFWHCYNYLIYFAQFQTTFVVDYRFQEMQKFKVDIYDADDKEHLEDLSKQDYIGSAKFTLAEVLIGGKMLFKPLQNEGKLDSTLISISYTPVRVQYLSYHPSPRQSRGRG